MNDNSVISEFKFIGNRVSKFNLITHQIKTRGQPVEVSFDFDYDLQEIRQDEGKVLGVIDFVVKVKAIVKKKVLFKIELVMEGAFGSEPQKLPNDTFLEMLEINGLITLAQISRAYILSVTSQSGINPPIRMPMINVMKLREMKHQTTDTNKG